jgi:cell division protein FtsW
MGFTSFWREDLWLNHSDKVWQTKQALVGIARGDWTGVGLGNSIQKYTKLPVWRF